MRALTDECGQRRTEACLDDKPGRWEPGKGMEVGGGEKRGLRTAQPENHVRSLGTLARAVSGKQWDQKSHERDFQERKGSRKSRRREMADGEYGQRFGGALL